MTTKLRNSGSEPNRAIASRLRRKRAWVFGGTMLLAACTSAPSDMTDLPIMTYDECANSSYCKVEGVLKLKEIDHTMMGKLAMNNGSCLNVSLPQSKIYEIKSKGPYKAIVIGRIFPSYPDPDIAKIYISGRRVGLSQCGNILLFVE